MENLGQFSQWHVTARLFVQPCSVIVKSVTVYTQSKHLWPEVIHWMRVKFSPMQAALAGCWLDVACFLTLFLCCYGRRMQHVFCSLVGGSWVWRKFPVKSSEFLDKSPRSLWLYTVNVEASFALWTTIIYGSPKTNRFNVVEGWLLVIIMHQ